MEYVSKNSMWQHIFKVCEALWHFLKLDCDVFENDCDLALWGLRRV